MVEPTGDHLCVPSGGGGCLSLSHLHSSSSFLISLINVARCPTFMNLGSNCRMYPKGFVLPGGTDDRAAHVEAVAATCL